jgi:hypothetical protein
VNTVTKPVVARISHRIPGRVRIKVRAQRGNPAYFREAVASLSKNSLIHAIEANPRTGSMLIVHSGPLEDLLTRAEEELLFSVAGIEPEEVPILDRLLEDHLAPLASIPAALSAGEIDFSSLAFLGLVALSIAQIARGNVAVPAVTSLWYATNVLFMRRTASDETAGGAAAIQRGRVPR